VAAVARGPASEIVIFAAAVAADPISRLEIKITPHTIRNSSTARTARTARTANVVRPI
jgi:hypothetical protein